MPAFPRGRDARAATTFRWESSWRAATSRPLKTPSTPVCWRLSAGCALAIRSTQWSGTAISLQDGRLTRDPASTGGAWDRSASCPATCRDADDRALGRVAVCERAGTFLSRVGRLCPHSPRDTAPRGVAQPRYLRIRSAASARRSTPVVYAKRRCFSGALLPKSRPGVAATPVASSRSCAKRSLSSVSSLQLA